MRPRWSWVLAMAVGAAILVVRPVALVVGGCLGLTAAGLMWPEAKWPRRLGIAGAVSLAATLRTTLFSQVFERTGEMGFEYIRRIEESAYALLRDQGDPSFSLQPFAYVLLDVLVTAASQPPELATKVVRGVLGSLDCLLVIALARGVGIGRRGSLLAGVLHASTLGSFWYLAGDQLRNFLGETFALAAVLAWVGGSHRRRGLRFLAFALGGAAGLSHRLYFVVFAALAAFLPVAEWADARVARAAARPWAPVVMGVATMAVAAALSPLWLPTVTAPGSFLPAGGNVADWASMSWRERLLRPGELVDLGWWAAVTATLLALRPSLAASGPLRTLFMASQALFFVRHLWMVGVEVELSRLQLVALPLDIVLLAAAADAAWRPQRWGGRLVGALAPAAWLAAGLARLEAEPEASHAVARAFGLGLAPLARWLFGTGPSAWILVAACGAALIALAWAIGRPWLQAAGTALSFEGRVALATATGLAWALTAASVAAYLGRVAPDRGPWLLAGLAVATGGSAAFSVWRRRRRGAPAPEGRPW